MAFKKFYKTVQFDIDKEIRTVLEATQGDTKSRGLFVPLVVNRVITPVTTEKMNFFALKPDGTRVVTAGVKDGDKFRVDFTNQTFSVAGTLLCALVLYGANGEKIADKKFKMTVDTTLEDGAIISKDERGILDRAFDLAKDILPRIEALHVPLLENLANDIGPRLEALDVPLLENLEQEVITARARFDSVDEQLTDIYTKVETDTALAQKADKADTYTKAEVEGKVELKADKAEIEAARGSEQTLGARLDSVDEQLNDIERILKSVEIKSWEDVQKIIRTGIADKVFSVGDQFTAKYAGVDYLWDIIGIDHDIPADPNFTHSLTIQSHDVLMLCRFDVAEPTNPDTSRANNGSNNYLESNIRQWLNDDNETFNFLAQTPYDVKPTVAPYTGAGFLYNLDPELKAVIGSVKKQVAKNTATDGGGQGLFEDKVFLLSTVETYGNIEGDTTGEKSYDYYSLLAPSATSTALSGRIKYLDGTSRYWWLRSPGIGNSYVPRYMHSAGNISGFYASSPYGLAPACTIY